MGYACSIIADSRAVNGKRITTFKVTFPRFILAEFNTHRMLSRNAASSRAIPTASLIKSVKDDPFIPTKWLKNKRGMQGGDRLTLNDTVSANALWLEARDKACFIAEALAGRGVHKQYVNRILEPFMWTTVLVTATEWANFFNLRCHPDAQPEFQTIANMMLTDYNTTDGQLLRDGEWHLPFTSDKERDETEPIRLVKIVAGRCARISYLTHDGKFDPDADVALAERLLSSGHMSPFEHPARASFYATREANLIGWMSYRRMIANEDNPLGAAALALAERAV